MSRWADAFRALSRYDTVDSVDIMAGPPSGAPQSVNCVNSVRHPDSIESFGPPAHSLPPARSTGLTG